MSSKDLPLPEGEFLCLSNYSLPKGFWTVDTAVQKPFWTVIERLRIALRDFPSWGILAHTSRDAVRKSRGTRRLLSRRIGQE
jgi:hypothetical protein